MGKEYFSDVLKNRGYDIPSRINTVDYETDLSSLLNTPMDPAEPSYGLKFKHIRN